MSWVADMELLQLIAHLIQPPGSIPSVGRVKRKQTNLEPNSISDSIYHKEILNDTIS